MTPAFSAVPRESLIAYTERIQELEARITRILTSVAGAPKFCRSCEAEIYWVRHVNGSSVPYTSNGINHYTVCRPDNRKRDDDRRYIPTTLRWAGQCGGCEIPMQAGDHAVFDATERKVYCPDCSSYVEAKTMAHSSRQEIS